MVSPMASAMPAPEMAPAKVSATQVMMVDRPQADPNANRSVIGPTVIAARVIGTIPTAIGRVGDGHHARRRNVRRAGGGGLGINGFGHHRASFKARKDITLSRRRVRPDPLCPKCYIDDGGMPRRR